VGLLLVLCFGEIGLILSVLFYLVSLILAVKFVLKEYRRSGSASSSSYRSHGLLIFSMDAYAAAAGFLHIVAQVGASKYGHIYVVVGGILVLVACVLWINTLMLAFLDYVRAENKFVPAYAIAFTLFEILAILGLMLQPAEV
jgi:hypothetical protein